MDYSNIRRYPNWILLLCSLIPLCLSFEQEGLFTAIAPNKIFNNSTYNIWITGDANGQTRPPPPLKLSINCSLTKYDGVTTWHELHSSEHRNWNQMIHTSFQTDFLFAESYEACSLIATHLETKKIQDQFPVTLIDKSEDTTHSIVIQMDKPAYKPEDEVRVRVITLDAMKLPKTSVPLTITVRDSKNMTVDRFSEFTESKRNGIRKFQFQLERELNLGPWTMTAESGGVKTVLTFLVEKYVLPKFFVKVTPTPRYFTIGKELTFHVKVQAYYINGKPLEGKCSIFLYAEGNKSSENQGSNLKVGELTNGTKFFGFSTPTAFGKYYLEANVSESKTGRWAMGKQSFKVYQTEPFQITWLNPVNTFIPGSPLDIQLAVSTIDNSPVFDPIKSALAINSTYHSNGINSQFTLKSSIPRNGLVTFRIKTPSNPETEFHSITVSYKQEVVSLPVPRAFQSKSKLQLSITTVENGCTVDHCWFKIDANDAVLKYISYLVYDGVNVIDFQAKRRISEYPTLSAYLGVSRPRRVYNELKVFIFFIHHFIDSGGIPAEELVSASTTWESHNYIDLQLSREKLAPAENVSLTFRTHPGSTIAIRGVDQSLLLLSHEKPNLDLDPAIDLNNIPSSSPVFTSSSDFINDFKMVGLDILTNFGQREHDNPPIINRRVRRQAGNYERRRELIPNNFVYNTETTRTEFPEVWLWEEIEAESERTVYQAYVPDTITSWYITALSVNKESGLAVTGNAKILKVFRPFFITLNLPYSVNQYKQFTFEVLIHNYLDSEMGTEITFFNNDDFEFIRMVEREEEILPQRIQVSPQTVEVVQFVARPLQLGILPMRIRAVAGQAGEYVIYPVNVVNPEVVETAEHCVCQEQPVCSDTIVGINFLLAKLQRETDEIKSGLKTVNTEEIISDFFPSPSSNLAKVLLLSSRLNALGVELSTETNDNCSVPLIEKFDDMLRGLQLLERNERIRLREIIVSDTVQEIVSGGFENAIEESTLISELTEQPLEMDSAMQEIINKILSEGVARNFKNLLRFLKKLPRLHYKSGVKVLIEAMISSNHIDTTEFMRLAYETKSAFGTELKDDFPKNFQQLLWGGTQCIRNRMTTQYLVSDRNQTQHEMQSNSSSTPNNVKPKSQRANNINKYSVITSIVPRKDTGEVNNHKGRNEYCGWEFYPLMADNSLHFIIRQKIRSDWGWNLNVDGLTNTTQVSPANVNPNFIWEICPHDQGQYFSLSSLNPMLIEATNGTNHLLCSSKVGGRIRRNVGISPSLTNYCKWNLENPFEMCISIRKDMPRADNLNNCDV